MVKLFQALSIPEKEYSSFGTETKQMAALIEGMQTVYVKSADSPKKDALAIVISESIRVLLKRIYNVEKLSPATEEIIQQEAAKIPETKIGRKPEAKPEMPAPPPPRPKKEPKDAPAPSKTETKKPSKSKNNAKEELNLDDVLKELEDLNL